MVIVHALTMNSSAKPNVNGQPPTSVYLRFTYRSPSHRVVPTFVLLRMLFDRRWRGRIDMRELNCVIIPKSSGWVLTVGAHRRGWFANKDRALRAAIVEAQKGRTIGFFTAVKVQHRTGKSVGPGS
jgi:hypothetical protein